MIWNHGGYGGIGKWLWEEPQYTGPYRNKGFVVFCPSRRAENDNPGKLELFFGEVDDSLAAIDFIAKLPYVDPDRIYMAGHSTGGTLMMLTALSTNKVRAAFSLGGAPDIYKIVKNGTFQNTPYPDGWSSKVVAGGAQQQPE